VGGAIWRRAQETGGSMMVVNSCGECRAEVRWRRTRMLPGWPAAADGEGGEGGEVVVGGLGRA
jgi:hypothetical protein